MTLGGWETRQERKASKVAKIVASEGATSTCLHCNFSVLCVDAIAVEASNVRLFFG